MNLDEAYRQNWIRHDLPTWANPPTVERAVEWLTSSMDEMDAHNGASLRVVLDRLAEHERTQATGGPPPPETRGWGNEQHVPPPESAARADMAPPARYGASNAERSEQ